MGRRYRVAAGRVAPYWAFDAAMLDQMHHRARQAFESYRKGEITRQSFTEERDRYRTAYATYMEKWSSDAEAVAYFEGRIVEAPDGWDD